MFALALLVIFLIGKFILNEPHFKIYKEVCEEETLFNCKATEITTCDCAKNTTTPCLAICYNLECEEPFFINKTTCEQVEVDEIEYCWNETRLYSTGYIPPTSNNPTASGISSRNFDRYEIIGCYEEYINKEGEKSLDEIVCNITEVNKNVTYGQICGDYPCACSDSPFKFYNNNTFYVKYVVYENPMRLECDNVDFSTEWFDENCECINSCEYKEEFFSSDYKKCYIDKCFKYKCGDYYVETWNQLK